MHYNRLHVLLVLTDYFKESINRCVSVEHIEIYRLSPSSSYLNTANIHHHTYCMIHLSSLDVKQSFPSRHVMG